MASQLAAAQDLHIQQQQNRVLMSARSAGAAKDATND
jgi:hypothetical protein